MENNSCDCGDPFQIHDSNDPTCSKVRGVAPKATSQTKQVETHPANLLITQARRVANLSKTIGDVTTAFGILTVFAGLFFSLQRNSIDLGNGYEVSTHPYVTLGIVLAVIGVLQIMVLRLFFNYIEMQARFREWEMTKP